MGRRVVHKSLQPLAWPGLSPALSQPKGSARSWGCCSLLSCPPLPLLQGKGLEQSHASSSLALCGMGADCPIPVSGWAAQIPQIDAGFGEEALYCLMSDDGQLASAGQGTILGPIPAVCRVNYCTGHMQNLDMHLCIPEQALTTDPCRSASPWGCRVGSLPPHP